jgi:hypothetical protein
MKTKFENFNEASKWLADQGYASFGQDGNLNHIYIPQGKPMSDGYIKVGRAFAGGYEAEMIIPSQHVNNNPLDAKVYTGPVLVVNNGKSEGVEL